MRRLLTPFLLPLFLAVSSPAAVESFDARAKSFVGMSDVTAPIGSDRFDNILKNRIVRFCSPEETLLFLSTASRRFGFRLHAEIDQRSLIAWITSREDATHREEFTVQVNYDKLGKLERVLTWANEQTVDPSSDEAVRMLAPPLRDLPVKK